MAQTFQHRKELHIYKHSDDVESDIHIFATVYHIVFRNNVDKTILVFLMMAAEQLIDYVSNKHSYVLSFKNISKYLEEFVRQVELNYVNN